MLLNRMSSRVIIAAYLIGVPLSAPAADWPQWGGANSRNMISQEKGLPDSFEADKDLASGQGDGGKKARNIKWVARLGSFTYGNPTVSDGRVYVGTDMRALRGDPRFKLSRGGLIRCLDEASGELLWQLAIPERRKLPAGTHFGQQHLGVCSSVTVDGDKRKSYSTNKNDGNYIGPSQIIATPVFYEGRASSHQEQARYQQPLD